MDAHLTAARDAALLVLDLLRGDVLADQPGADGRLTDALDGLEAMLERDDVRFALAAATSNPPRSGDFLAPSWLALVGAIGRGLLVQLANEMPRSLVGALLPHRLAEDLRIQVAAEADRAAVAMRGRPRADDPALAPEAKALAYLAMHPTWTNKRIAEEVGCDVGSLYRWPTFRAARQAMRGGAALPRGSKSDGRMEAIDS